MCKFFRNMAERKSYCTRLKIVAIVLMAIAVSLGIIAFFAPPPWKIDNSVIAFIGEIFAFVSLLFAWESVDRGIDAKVKHGQTEIDLINPDKKDEE